MYNIVNWDVVVVSTQMMNKRKGGGESTVYWIRTTITTCLVLLLSVKLCQLILCDSMLNAHSIDRLNTSFSMSTEKTANVL